MKTLVTVENLSNFKTTFLNITLLKRGNPPSKNSKSNFIAQYQFFTDQNTG